MSDMSGVVVKLNDDEEGSDEDDAGLLSHRGYDDSEDDLDDLRQNKSRGRSVLKRLRVGGDKGLVPYPAMRSGTVMQLLNTLTICCIFFGMGLTKSLIESPPTAEGIQTSEREMATSVGFVLGFLFGGFLLARFSRNFIMLLTLQVLGSMLITVPWIDSDWATDTVYIIIGVCIAILMIGGNVICLDFWGRKSGAYIHALHFCLSLGLLTGPLLVDPLSSAHVPAVIRKALPFALSHSNSVGSTQHIIQKRALSNDILTAAPDVSTLDPLLVNIFGIDPTSKASSTTIRTPTSRQSTTSTTTLNPIGITEPIKKVPKPKPAFNDGQKLDNSRDWERVKIAKPPIEDLTAPEITTLDPITEQKETLKDIAELLSDNDSNEPPKMTSTSTTTSEAATNTTDRTQLIRQELSQVHQDMEQNVKLLNWFNAASKATSGGLRRKREIGIATNKGFGMGGGPPLYNQNRGRMPGIPAQWNNPAMGVPGYPVPGPRGKIQNINYAYDYDYADPIGTPYGNSIMAPKNIEPPPREVEEAVETISNYLNNASQSENGQNQMRIPNNYKVTTLPPTTTTTTTTTKKTTTLRTTQLLTTTEKKTSAVLVPKKKKPTSSFDNDKDSNDGANNSNDTIKALLDNYGVSKNNIGFILDATYTWIISLILLVCMCYRPQRGEPRSRQEADELFGSRSSEESRIFKATVTVLLFFFNLLHWGMFVSFSQTLPQFKILASTATYLERVFVGVFTATRFLAILTAGIVHPAAGIFISLFIVFVGSLVLVFTQQISAAAVWAGVILQAIGLATLLPTSLVWGEAYVLMSSQVVAVVCWGLALAELMVPYSMKLLSIDTQTWLGLAMVGATTLATGLFTCVFLLARRHGSRFSRPQASGYELASQDDLNQELLEDDDDFEVAEPSLELSGTHA